MSAPYLPDFESRRLDGIAYAAIEAGRDGRFNVPLVTEIGANLWMGGCVNGVRLPDEFEFVVSLYPWEKYQLGRGTKRIEYPLLDSADVPDDALIARIVDDVTSARRKGRTLVHCQMGLNRSGLITAAVLMANGIRPIHAIAMLRRKRHPLVLCNQAFEAWLLSQDTTSSEEN